MTREELDTLWFQAMRQSIEGGENFVRYHFASLVAAEKEQQMIRDGWRRCAVNQRTTQFCGLLEDAVKAERESVGNIILDYAGRDDLSDSDESLLKHLFELIRARGET